MKLIVLTGLPTKAKELMTHDLAAHYLDAGQRVAVLDNANIRDGLSGLDLNVVTMRGGCACCSVAGKLFSSVDELADTTDVAIMAADNQTHVGNLIVVLENLVDGSKTPVDVVTVALVDERTQCCFPYVAETLELSTDITLTDPFTVDTLVEKINAQ